MVSSGAAGSDWAAAALPALCLLPQKPREETGARSLRPPLPPTPRKVLPAHSLWHPASSVYSGIPTVPDGCPGNDDPTLSPTPC